MVVATEPDLTVEIVVGIGSAVTIGVDGFGELSHLGDHNVARRGSLYAEAVMKAAGKEFPIKGIRVGRGFGDKDIIAARSHVELAIRVKGEASDFGWGALGQGNGFDFEIGTGGSCGHTYYDQKQGGKVGFHY